MSNYSVQKLTEAGLALVRMPLGKKGPTEIGWNLRQKVISDPSKAASLYGMNIGIAHAYCTPTPTCAIDIDNYKTAKQWLTAHGIDLRELLLASDAVVIWSGKTYSLKLLYRLPKGIAPLESKKINDGYGKSALEFRCASKDGKTVQDVIPPSIHPDGHQYQWTGHGSPDCISTIPPKLLAVWMSLVSGSNQMADRCLTNTVQQQPREETPRQVAIIQDALSYISADCDYEKWRSVIWAILSTRWRCAQDLALEWSMSAPSRYDEDAFWLVVNSYQPNHFSHISLGTIYHHARIGGWNG